MGNVMCFVARKLLCPAVKKNYHNRLRFVKVRNEYRVPCFLTHSVYPTLIVLFLLALVRWYRPIVGFHINAAKISASVTTLKYYIYYNLQCKIHRKLKTKMFEILPVNTLLVFLFFRKLAVTTRAAARGYHFSRSSTSAANSTHTHAHTHTHTVGDSGMTT